MANEVGTITLKADSTGIKHGTQALRDMESQANRTEKETKSLTKSSSALGGALGKLAGILAGGAIFRTIIKNTRAQEDATAQLNASLRSTGRESQAATQALLDHAAALQQVTTFGDEAVISAQSQLLTFTQIGGETFPRATEAVLDLATKMGGDLRGAVVQVGKALNDPILGVTALARSGIQFTEQQKDMIKALVESGDLLGAQKIILSELETQFGGSARAARDTFGGALDGLKNKIGDLMEADGDSLPGATRAINDLTAALSDPKVKEGFDTITTGVVNMVAALAQAPGIIKFVADELKAGFGSVADTDIPRVEERLVILQRRLEELGDNERGFWDRFFSDGATRSEIEAEIEHLSKLVDDFYNKPREIKTTDTAASAVAAALPAGPAPDAGIDEKALAKRLREEEKALQDAERATENLRKGMADLAIQQGGDSVKAAVDLANAIAHLDEQERLLREGGKLDAQAMEQLAALREGAILQHQERIDAINEEKAALDALLSPAEQMLSSLQFELELQGLSNTEREKRIALLRAETDETTAAGAAIVATIDQLAANDEAIRAMDGFRMSATDAFVSIANGSKNAKEAFGDMMNSIRDMLLRMLAEKLIQQVFGGFGSTGGGFGGVLSSIFGGGKATGGPVRAGTPYLVGEQGPELIVPRAAGTVVPNGQLGGSNVVVNIDAREQDDPGKILSLIPIIQTQVEQSIGLKMRRGYFR